MTATTAPTARRWTPGAALIALACLAATHAPAQPRGGVDYESIPAQDPLILQWFEGSWSTMHRRMGDVFAAGYRGLWVPPPGRGSGDANFIGQIGYDVYDRFDFGQKSGTGSATRYGDASTLGRLIDQAARARLDTYYDSIMNHNGSGLHSNGGFVDAGGYPGFAMSYGGDPWGDFNPPSDNSNELTMYLANLIDIAQDKVHSFIRHPATDGPNNVPGAGTKPNQPIDWYHRRFYPDLDPAPGDVRTPSGFNLTNPLGGDPVAENATGLLLRYTQYMNEVAGFTGIRIDAVKHIPTWFFNDLWDGVIRDRGRPTLEGNTTTPFSFGEAFTGDVGQLLSYHNRSFGNNRTVLDFNHYFTLNGVMNAGGFGNLQDLVWANIDNDNGNRFDGSAGVYFIASHDKDGGGGSNIGNFWVAMRKGHTNIYHHAGEFPPVQINGVDQDFPKSGGSRGDAIGAFVPDSFGNSSLIADMADIRRRFAFGNWRERWLGADVLAFEYDGRLVYALCDAGNSGYQSITVSTEFPPFTLLKELTGNAARYNDRTGTSDIPVTINVNELGQAALRVPNNSHAFGYVAYAPVTPNFSWGLTNVESTLPPDDGMTPVATRRLTEVRRITSASSTLTVTTDGTETEVLVNIGNRDLNGSGQPDIRRGALAGFESFTTASTGSYSMNIDWSALGDGHHFVEIAAVKGGLGGQHAAVWSSERFTVLVDLEAPNGTFASPPSSHVVMGGETLHVQVLTDGTEDNALINVSPTFVADRPTGEFGQMRTLGRRYWGLDVVPNSSDRVITVRLFEDDGGSRDIVRTLLGPGDMTPTPTVTPTPAPDMNPFAMDGALDAGTCQIGDLHVRELNGWLYIATNAVQTHDAFIYVASDPSTLQAANWAKAGQVGAWDFFLGGEESNDFAGWFDSTGNFVSNGPDYVSARSGTFMEGAIRKSLAGGGTSHVALGRFGTGDGGALVGQSPASVDADGNIQASEFRAITTGVDPCSGMTPTPSPTPTITPTPTPTPVPGARTLTIGPGPSLGFTAGREYFEEFQDWRAEDCRALDEHSTDTYLLQGGSDDGLNNSRDLVAFYTYDDPMGGKFHLRADMLDLLYDGGAGGVNMSGLDLIVMLDFGTPSTGQTFVPNFADATTAHQWEVALVLQAHDEWELWDETFTLLSRKNSDPMDDINTGAFAVYSNADLDAFEMSIDRSLLMAEGWDGTSPISIQVATMVGTGFELPGFASNLVDTLPSMSDPVSDTVMTEAFTTAASCGTTPFAYILHGNQAISGADYIQQLIHNDIVQTPNGNPTGYHRALESAQLFRAAPTIHVSATLIASMLWAKSPVPSDPQDGPSFVDFIRSFVDGSASVPGHIMSGVFSEHIMPYFEGTPNQWSIGLNEDFLASVFGLSYPQANTIFWVPERVIQGTTFADFATAGYNWIVLDEDEHLKTWYPAEHPANAHRIHRINGTNVLWISEEQDYFKFANTDGGLWLDTRTHLLDLARAGGEEYTLVFDDWEAYAGRSFLSFETGTDNPDNWNANIRWIANHPWIEVTALDDLAARGWTPIELGADTTLPIHSYDFLQHATEGSYDNWYYGRAPDSLAGEEVYDGYRPFIRTDLNQRAVKSFGQVNTNSLEEANGISKDVFDEVAALSDNAGKRLAQLSYSTGTFETAWHDEDQAIRCEDRTFCIPDTTDDLISEWQKRITFHNLRKTGIYAEVARWEASLAPPRGATATALAKDVDHDGEMEYILYNDFMLAVFENDGGRLIASFVRDESTGRASTVTGNLLGFPDFEDEREASSTGGVRTSAFVDWWAQGTPDPIAYVNDIYTVQVNAGELVFTSSDGLISKSLVMAPNEALLTAAYTVDPSVEALYVRHGLAPDIEALLTGGQAALSLTQGPTRVTLTNTVNDVRAIANAGTMAFTQFSDGTSNSPRNQPLLHIVELSGTGTSFSTSLGAGAGSVAPTPTPTMTPTFSPTPTFTPTPSATPSITPGMPLATPGGPDSDGDGYSDALEVALGSNPADPDSTPDFADYNDSGAADLLDALELARAAGGAILQPYNALLDVNGDGFVNHADAVALYLWCIGSLEAIPGEEP